jgi:hypothetical protein
LYSGDIEDYTAPAITVTAPSTIESGAAVAQMGTLNLPANTLLTINGSASFTGTTLTGAAHQVAVTGFNANTSLGTLSGATALTKTGNGNLFFLKAPPTGTTIADNAGFVVSMGNNTDGDPLATTPITFNGGNFGLSSTAGDVTSTIPVASATNLTIAAGSFGNGNISTATNVTLAPPTLVAPTGNTLTLRSNDGNFTLNITPQITGTGAVVIEEGKVNLNGGVNNVGGNLTNRSATVNINGNLATGALLQQGNLPNGTTGANLGDALIAGQYLPGSLTVTGTTNATSITTTRGTLTLTGLTTDSGILTGNGNGVMNLGPSTHASATLTNGATLNANGTFTSPGTLTLTRATANLNAATSVDRVILNGGGTVKIAGSLATGVNGVNVTQASNLNFDAGAGNTALLTGGDVSLDTKAVVHVVSGTADLTAVSIHSNPQIVSLLNNTLGGRLTNLTTDGNVRLDPRDVNVANNLYKGTATPAPARTANLTGPLDFANDNAVANFFGFTNNGAGGNDVDRFNMTFVGRLQATANGTLTLGFFEQDDNVAVWLDSNQNGTFEGNELVSQGGCCQTTVDTATPQLAAGQFYNVMFSVEDTGGGGSLGGRINGAVVNPLAQPGVFSYLSENGAGSDFQIDANAEMRVKAFDGVSSIKLASNATLTLSNKLAQTSSSAARIQMTSNGGNVFLGDNNVVTVGELLFINGSVLTIDLPAGATAGNGRLVVNGSVTGFTGVHTNINAGLINVQGGTLIMNTPIDGLGQINANLLGTIGGTSSINMPVNIIGSATLAPGDPASNGGLGTLTIGGTLNFNGGGNLAIQLKNKTVGSFDQVNVTGDTNFIDITNTNLALSLDAGFTGTLGDQFPILLNGTSSAVIGTFAQGNSITVGAKQFQIHYDGTFDSTAGNDVYLQYVVPEPGTIAIMLGGLATLVGLNRHRRRR